MTKFRVGVQLHPQQTSYAAYAEAVRQTESIGVDSIWNWDHFFPLYGDAHGNHFEGWTLLTAMATLTQRVDIGCMVTCNSYRNPALLMHMAKTVDHISNGRLILGIGAGWFERDYQEFGYKFGTAADRLHALGEALPIIKQRMAAEIPPPVRNPIPILVGGGGEKVTLKLTAEYADMWNGFGPPEKWQRKNEILTEWCQKVGRNPADIVRTASIGTEDVPHKLDAFAEAGATHLIVGMGAPWDFKLIEQLVRWRDSAG
ncbi:MAG: LLM class F420-dependent oxidoreductase [Aggregatilineales bacterium]